MKKTLTMVLAFALIFALGIGATLAWLTATSGEVKNTFTTSDINITLTETFNKDTNGDGKNDAGEFKMIPGHTITKDPKVTVVADSEPCYLFVKVEKSSNFDSFMEYAIDSQWTPLTGVQGVDNVYYMVIDSADKMGTPYSVLKNDQVKVLDGVTKTMMNGLTADNYPTLTFTAYASQLYKNNTATFTAAEAWANAQPTTTSGD